MGLKEWLIHTFSVPPVGAPSIPSEQSRTADRDFGEGSLKERASRVLQTEQEEFAEKKRRLVEAGTRRAQELTAKAREMSIPFVQAMQQSGIAPILSELREQLIQRKDSSLMAKVVIEYAYYGLDTSRYGEWENKTGEVIIAPVLPDFTELTGGFTFSTDPDRIKITTLEDELKSLQSIKNLNVKSAHVFLGWDYSDSDEYGRGGGYGNKIKAVFTYNNVMHLDGYKIPRSDWNRQRLENAVLDLYLRTVPKPS